jgi:hypothetical protein
VRFASAWISGNAVGVGVLVLSALLGMARGYWRVSAQRCPSPAPCSDDGRTVEHSL